MTTLLHGITPLTHLGVIRAQGDEAAKFLHGQLTQDFALLGPQQARLAAYLSPKGRMLASFIGCQRSATEVLLVCSRDLLAATLKRLSMFVLRTKVKLTDASDEFALYGLAGDALISIAGSAYPAWAKADFDDQILVHLYPALGQPRGLWIAPQGSPAPQGQALDAALWAWGEVRSGVATLSAPLVETFVPQMLNYESVGGVNFKKGCYPGQEVVARSQFRGQLTGRGGRNFHRRRCRTSRGPGGAKRPRTRWRLGRPGVPANPRQQRRPARRPSPPGAPAPALRAADGCVGHAATAPAPW